ncbi:hypothetical protein HAX54_022371, partial [Datura stramonium]|nr:hypothetical protein [Datura stramonium]
ALPCTILRVLLDLNPHSLNLLLLPLFSKDFRKFRRCSSSFKEDNQEGLSST